MCKQIEQKINEMNIYNIYNLGYNPFQIHHTVGTRDAKQHRLS